MSVSEGVSVSVGVGVGVSVGDRELKSGSLGLFDFRAGGLSPFVRRGREDRFLMLRVHAVVLELIREVAPVANVIGRRDKDLASQLRRALSSVALNIAEASDQRGARRDSHYSIALGSARESWSALQVAAAWGYIATPHSFAARFDEVIGTLVRVTHPR